MGVCACVSELFQSQGHGIASLLTKVSQCLVKQFRGEEEEPGDRGQLFLCDHDHKH